MTKLKKAAQIVMLVGSILGIFIVSGLIIAGIVMFVIGGNAEVIRQMIADGTIDTKGIEGTPEQIAQAVALIFVALGVFMFVFAVPALIASILGFVNMKVTRKGGLIATIVLSVLGLNTVLLVGSILGVVCIGREQSQPVVNE